MVSRVVADSLSLVWRLLQRLDVPAAVMGGLALAAWKYSRATRDVDLLVGVAGGDLDRLLDQLRAAGLRDKRTPPVVKLGELQIVQMLCEPEEAFMELQVDLLLANSPYHQEALRRRVPVRLPDLDLEVAVLTCEDVVLHKLLAGRLIDRVDGAQLLRANRASFDMDYVFRWTERLGIARELAEVWQEAFPGQSLPGSA